jgi:hypothetical protein
VTGNSIASGQVVKSLNGLHDAVNLAAGSNVTITPGSGNTLTISATGSVSGLGGSGSANTVAKFTGATTLGNSSIFDNGSSVGVGTASPAAKLDVAGQVRAAGGFLAPWGPVLAVPGGPNTRLMTMHWDGINGDRVDLEVPGATANSALYSFTANGRLGIGTSTPAATLDVNGGAKLGSDAPVIRMKKVTGTTSSVQNGLSYIPHGLADGTILSVSVMVEYYTDSFVPPSYAVNSGYEFSWFSNNGNIVIWNRNGNSANILSKPVKILITYEQ